MRKALGATPEDECRLGVHKAANVSRRPVCDVSKCSISGEEGTIRVAPVKLLGPAEHPTTYHTSTTLSRRCSKEAEDCCSRTRHQRS